MNCSLFFRLILLLIFAAGCGSSGDFVNTVQTQTSGTRQVTFRLNLAQAQGTDEVPLSFTEFEFVSVGPARGRSAPTRGNLTPDIVVNMPVDATSCELFLLEDGDARLRSFFPLPDGIDDVEFNQPSFHKNFAGAGATGLRMTLFEQPLLKDKPTKITVETEEGVDVTKDGEFEVDPPGAVTIDENGVVTGLQAASGVTIRFRLRVPVFDFAVGAASGAPIVTLYDSSQIDKGPIDQFLAFDSGDDGVQVATGDFDGDGQVDVGCLGVQGIRVFGKGTDLLSEFAGPSSEDSIIGAGDLNGDGVDILVTYAVEAQIASFFSFQNSLLGLESTSPLEGFDSVSDVDIIAGGIVLGSDGRPSVIDTQTPSFVEGFDCLGFSSSGFDADRSLFCTTSTPAAANDVIFDTVPTGSSSPVQLSNLPFIPTDITATSASTPGQLFPLLGSSENNQILEFDQNGNQVGIHVPNLNGNTKGLKFDRTSNPPPPKVLETSVVVDVVEGSANPDFLAFFVQWAGLITSESPNLQNLYAADYSYNGDDRDDLTTFATGFDFEVTGPTFIDFIEDDDEEPLTLSTLQFDAIRSLTESTFNVQQTANTRFECRVEHQTTGSNPLFLIQTQREVSSAITATSGNSSPAIPSSPVLQSFAFLQTNSAPLTSLPLGGTILVEAQVSGLFPVTGNTTEIGSVVFRVAGQSFPLQDQGGGSFSATVNLPSSTPGLFAPTVVAENRRLAGPTDFLNTASASIARSEELAGQ